MQSTPRFAVTGLSLCAMLLPLAACAVDVHRDETGKTSDVNVWTPAAQVSVHTDIDARDTGLGVYPGATPLRDRHDPESANVNVTAGWFGVKVVAAKFQSDDRPEKVLDFYRNEMSPYGKVVECRGNVDFRGRRNARQPVCHERAFRSDVELVTGTEDRQRIVAVKPRGDGTEFALVYVQTRGDD